MGNIEVTDLAPVREDERRELNLSRKVNYKQYCKHVRGDFAQACLSDLPWSIRDSISLYECMDVSFNQISQLPAELPLRLPHLHTLNLSHNQITSLPDGFSLLFHLKDLKLNHNKLLTLPDSFPRLVKLEKLDLSYNLLRTLPEDIGTMESLEKLNLNHNRLRELPASMGNEKLKILIVTYNKLTFPPAHIVNQGSDAVLNFLRRGVANGDAKPVASGNVFPRRRNNQFLATVQNETSAQAQYAQRQTHTTNTAIRMKTPLLPPVGSSKLDALDVRDRILGIIYGAAIGDALGVATQFMSGDECRFHYDWQTLHYTNIVRDAHRTRWRQGDWTANFDHLCLVLDSVLRWSGVVDELDFAKRLVAWRNHGFPELGDTEGYTFCKTILAVVEKDSYTLDPHHIARMLIDSQHTSHQLQNDADDEDTEKEEVQAMLDRRTSADSAAETSFTELTEVNADLHADNGALVRTLVLGIPFFHDVEEVANNAVRICKATHADPRCLAVSSTITTLLSYILQGHHNLSDTDDQRKLLERCGEIGRKYMDDESHQYDFDQACNTEDLDSVNANEPGQVVYVMKTLSILTAALRANTDFRRTLYDVIMKGGDSCTNGAVTGAMMGAMCGFSNLPSDWLDGLRKRQRDWLTIKVNILLDLMGLP